MTARELVAVKDGVFLSPVGGGSLWGAYRPTITTTDTQTYEPDLEPLANGDGSWTYTLPARPDPPTPRRIERIWCIDGRTSRHTTGDIVIFEGEFVGNLGAAAQSQNQWHVIWQCHGPGDGTLTAWGGPPVGLDIKRGRIHLSGGEQHPNNQFTATGYYGWEYDLGPWVDGVRHRIRIEAKLGPDPDGWITCRFDGATICERWRPQGYWKWDGVGWTGNYPGTIYSTPATPATDWVQSRSGLYRGAQNSEAPPTDEQWIRWWPTDASRSHQP